MKFKGFLLRQYCVGILLLLVACQSSEIEPVIPEEEPGGATGSFTLSDLESKEGLEEWEIVFQRQRVIGDLLYDALNALSEDRLLTPVGNNAHARYLRVLAYDPGNQLALEGLQNIVNRYLQLASQASRQGKFDSSQVLLDRARFVDEDDPAIEQAQLALQAEMKSGDLVFELDLQALAAQTDELQQHLSDIASQAVDHQAFLLITAPRDEQARWVYGVMRDSVNGYRLRANIERGSYAIVRLRMPQSTVTEDQRPAEVEPQIELIP